MKIKIDVDIPPAPDGGKLVVVRAKDVPRGGWYYSATVGVWRKNVSGYWGSNTNGRPLSDALVVRSVPPKPPIPDETVVLDAGMVETAIGNGGKGLHSVDAMRARLHVADEIDRQCRFDHFK